MPTSMPSTRYACTQRCAVHMCVLWQVVDLQYWLICTAVSNRQNPIRVYQKHKFCCKLPMALVQ